MPNKTQTNLEFVREQNQKFLDDLSARVRAGGASASEFVIAVGRAAEIEAAVKAAEAQPTSESLYHEAQARLALAKAKHLEAQTEALKSAPAPKDAIDPAKIFDGARDWALLTFNAIMESESLDLPEVAEFVRDLRSTLEDIAAARRLVDVCSGGVSDKMDLLRARGSSFK